jgi:hypothetical protein
MASHDEQRHRDEAAQALRVAEDEVETWIRWGSADGGEAGRSFSPHGSLVAPGASGAQPARVKVTCVTPLGEEVASIW